MRISGSFSQEPSKETEYVSAVDDTERVGRGVCGTAWKEARTLIVPDVEQFPGHIACSSDSKSEIVVPIIKEGNVIGVLDIDSDTLNSFDETDARYLREICTYIG